ncbi:NAC domain [Arabidopsis suecica]|uniref:NAC domain n=1 Tax=Arabidopsis suecica TaxID=45249 RepID=A0A8T2BTC1_ARASU|nr:NAC domain [Arabidopsis suecica]
MEDDAAYDLIKEDLLIAEDEVIISRYLKPMIVNGDSWPDHFIVDAKLFNKNPNKVFDSESPSFVIVKPRTEACGKTDGCESGCWRIMARDKLIKSEETGKILGFKKILKFCLKRKPREYKRSWVMEEYRLTKNFNWKQDHVICKIRFMFEAEISFLLTKHFYTTSESDLGDELLPSYGYSSNTQEEDESYLVTIVTSEGNYWPSYVTNDVYCLHPVDLVDPQDPMFHDYGTCIFANGTCGETDKCDGGYWKILHPDELITGKVNGFKKVFKFYETERQRYVWEGEYVKVTWTIEEYRLSEKVKEDKVLCVIKLTRDS